jgi:hypothetical protein
MLDPVNIDAQLAGGVIWGLSHAMRGELTYADGAPEQTNFHAYQSMRLYQAPQIVTKALQTTGRIKGIGEPGVPPAARRWPTRSSLPQANASASCHCASTLRLSERGRAFAGCAMPPAVSFRGASYARTTVLDSRRGRRRLRRLPHRPP